MSATLTLVNQDADACYRALLARDSRFDGVFFTGVTTTGIYCRPVCRAKTPRRSSCRFFASAALAEKAGFRACLRCRPELAPGHAPTDAVPHLVARTVAQIAAGALNERSVDELASSLGVTDRHLRRAMQRELGVTPVELAQSRRLALAKQLLHDTELGLAEIAFASGFASVRRFNALFGARFGRPPSALRRVVDDDRGARAGTERVSDGARAPRLADAGSILLVLDYRPPLAWDALLGFLAARAIPGVERVEDGAYARTVSIGGAVGRVVVQPHPRRAALAAWVSPELSGKLMQVVARVRALFDLDCEPASIAGLLARDPLLDPLVHALPGLRVPGAFDPFEMAVRAVLGQQVTVRAATTIAGRVARAFGRALDDGREPDLVSPAPERLARTSADELAALGLPGARARAIVALAQACASGALDLAPGQPRAELLERLRELPGVGPWTAEYVAMRVLRAPDAFPGSDLGVRKALGDCTAPQALERSLPWSPWRSYAVMYLWSALGMKEIP